MIKRAFDLVVAAVGLILLFPFFAVVGLLIKWDSPGPIFFKQIRMGRGFRPFLIYKLRTMKHDAESAGRLITVADDSRITRLGRFLRKAKIDELPQLINVLRGEMSFVGPRPEVPQFVELFRQEYAEILTVRPGITDLASLKYRDEAAILGRAADPEAEYVKRVLPDKIRLAKDYLRCSSFPFDIGLMVKTVFKLIDGRVSS